MIDKAIIMKALSLIDDPELGKSLTELEMVKSVEIKGNRVQIGIALTVPGCPLKNKIHNDIMQRVGEIEGVGGVDVDFGVMSEEQRKYLMGKLYGDEHKTTTSADDRQQITVGAFAKRVIVVASGKGGVGKSTVTCNLAAAFSRRGLRVGVLDADIYGFSIPRMLGLKGQPEMIDGRIVPLRKGNMQVMSMGFFIDEDMPVIWRGPLLHKAINQFLTDVLWDKNDFLLIDLPPGTGDVTLTIAQSLPMAELLIVTTPQPIASHTAGRVARLAERTHLRVLGVIENMAYYEANGIREYIFGKGGGRELSKVLGVPFMGEIPIKTEIREGADNGLPVVLSDSPAACRSSRDGQDRAGKTQIADYYLQIADTIIADSPAARAGSI